MRFGNWGGELGVGGGRWVRGTGMARIIKRFFFFNGNGKWKMENDQHNIIIDRF